jgi:hypothetical protein
MDQTKVESSSLNQEIISLTKKINNQTNIVVPLSLMSLLAEQLPTVRVNLDDFIQQKRDGEIESEPTGRSRPDPLDSGPHEENHDNLQLRSREEHPSKIPCGLFL